MSVLLTRGIAHCRMEPMEKVYNVQNAAKYLEIPASRVRKLFQSEELTGTKFQNVVVFPEKSLRAYKNGRVQPPLRYMDRFLTVNDVAQQLKFNVPRVVSLFSKGKIKAQVIGQRFDEKIWLTTKQEVLTYQSTIELYGVEQHLKIEGDNYVILGTRKMDGEPLRTKKRYRALQLARQAYEKPLLYKTGQIVWAWLKLRHEWHRFKINVQVQFLEDVKQVDKIGRVRCLEDDNIYQLYVGDVITEFLPPENLTLEDKFERLTAVGVFLEEEKMRKENLEGSRHIWKLDLDKITV